MLQAVAVQLKKKSKQALQNLKPHSSEISTNFYKFISLHSGLSDTNTHTHTHTFQVYYHIIFTRTWKAIHTNSIKAGTTLSFLFFSFFFFQCNSGVSPQSNSLCSCVISIQYGSAWSSFNSQSNYQQLSSPVLYTILTSLFCQI